MISLCEETLQFQLEEKIPMSQHCTFIMSSLLCVMQIRHAVIMSVFLQATC